MSARRPRLSRFAAAFVAIAGVGLAAPTPAVASLQHLVPSASPAPVVGPASTYHAVTAFTAYSSKGRLAPRHSVTVSLAARRGLPAAGGFSAVAVEVTVWQATNSTVAAVSAAGSSSRIRVVTASAKRAVSGFTIVPVAKTGAIQIRLGGGHARARIVVVGYEQAGSGGTTFHPLVPASVLAPHRVAAGATRSVSVVGAPRTGLPPNGHIAAVALAVTVTHPTATTVVTGYPRGQPASTGQPMLSAPHGRTASGVGIVKVGAHGDVSLRNAHGRATLSAAVEGYWTTDRTGASIHSVSPPSSYGGRTVANGWRSVKVAGRGGVPVASHTSAVLLSITAGPASGAAYLAIAPTGIGRPSSGQVSVAAHSTVTTSVAARLNGASIHIYANRRLSLSVSVVGWFGSTASGIDVNASAGGCSSPLPSAAGFAVIGATSGKPYGSVDPTCFTTQTTEATQLAAAPEYYMNLADPGKASTAHWHKGGPRACDVGHDYDVGCAYDYGYEAAKAAVTFARDHGMAAGSRWWLDIEPDNSWGSHDLAVPGHRAANIADIHGALHYLGSQPLPAGIYTETAWWAQITGGAPGFSTVAVWGGGAGSPAAARANCRAVSITGGPALLAQWFSNVQDDHDVAC